MIIFSIGIILLAYAALSKKFSLLLGMSFIFLIMGFQENCFTDYPSYKIDFEYGVDGYTTKEWEFAFKWMWNLCNSIMNFHFFVTLTSFIQCLIWYLMIKKYVVKRYQYFSVLIIFFTFNIMLIQMTAMRQSYAVESLLFAYYLLGKRRYLGSILAAIIAFGFHNSALIALPFFIILIVLMITKKEKKIRVKESPNLDKRAGFKTAYIWFFSFFIFYFLKYTFFISYVNPILTAINGFSLSSYLGGFDNDIGISLWILLYNSIFVFLTALYFTREQDIFKKYLALLTLTYYFLFVGTFGFGNLMRSTLYFIIFSIVVLPNVAEMLRISYGKNIASSYVLLNMVYLMYFSVPNMLIYRTDNATGFGSYMFSFIVE